ncbi:curved DNA-binding protein [Pseudomonas sp. RIT-PI-AD]|uniref:curved DNA-binding protein n=1 Tax=Pseudomonas sp. RIT-PI-AD TaxID=3035294 RepID=UPI0021DB2849|nr:curved DNA-binding protein [Pseudomonas sp. RIT-PI-AD]
MEFKDYYQALGVAPEADEKTIKTAYRKLARQYHPDVSKAPDAEEKFKEVAEAYEVLKNAEKRAEYDELRRYGDRGGFQPPPGWRSSAGQGEPHGRFDGDFSDFFESIFGSRAGAPRGPRRGQDVELELPVFLEETLAEQPKQISYKVPAFDAQGRREDLTRTLNLKIPAGVLDGERIRLKGQGAPGSAEGPAGDLYLTLRLVPHPLFDVEAHNLILTVPLAPWEAALGAKIAVPTLHGRINLSIPPDSQSGQRLRIKGKGLPTRDGHGDLFALLKVVMPDKTPEDARDLWRELAQRTPFDPRAEWSKAP